MPNKTSERQKRVAVFLPAADARERLCNLLRGLGFLVEPQDDGAALERAVSGGADLILIDLAMLGPGYPEVIAGLPALRLSRPKAAPVLALCSLNLALEAREKLLALGVREVLSLEAPWLELLFAINRMLFPKFRELRRYTRVFGGFPIRFRKDTQWREGTVYNISQEGAFIGCTSPPEEDSRLQVRFSLPGTEAPFDVQAVVSWINDAQGAAFTPEGMGISFLILNGEEHQSLRRFIAGRVTGTGRPA